jgi:ATP-dependent Lhr-like helicase
MTDVRSTFPWLDDRGGTPVVTSRGETSWWTFAGGRANAALAHELSQRTGLRVASDNFSIRFPSHTRPDDAERALRDLRDIPPEAIVSAASEQALDGLKFSECLPPDLATRVIQARLSDVQAVAEVLIESTRFVIEG